MSRRPKSPFPGMDPFLEVNPRWHLFHAWFVRELARQSLPKAEDLGCWIDVERSIYQREPTGELVLIGEPHAAVGRDLSVAQWSDTSTHETGVALAEPRAVHEIVLDADETQQHWQDYLVVRELGQFKRVLAVLELLSFANKKGSYAPKYQEKRRRLLTSRAHFMEIDFLREGPNPSRDSFPELAPTPYFILVARKNGGGRHEEGYPLRLQEPLPVIGLPLDLAAAFTSAYELSVHRGEIQYATEPVPGPPLNEEDAAWVASVLKPVG